MKTSDLARMEAAARAATPGPWRRGAKTTAHVYGPDCVVHSLPLPLDPERRGSHPRWKANAAHIAASNPAAVIELIEAYRQAVKYLRRSADHDPFYDAEIEAFLAAQE